MEMIGILADPVRPEFDHLLRRLLALVRFLEDVFLLILVEKFAATQDQAPVPICFARLVAGLRDGFHQHFERFVIRFQAWCEPAFVADRSRVAALLQHALQRVECLRAHAQRLGKLCRADGSNHEFLKIHRVVGMRAAIDDVHHRNRQHASADAAQVAIKRRHFGWRRRRARSAIDTARIALAPSFPFVVGADRLQHGWSIRV